jgi:hypothetical protein
VPIRNAKSWQMIARLGSRRVRILTGTALIAALTLAVIAYAAPARPPHDFSGQYDFPGLFGTDALGGFPATVSAAQAFHDHGIVPPPHIRDLRYAANSTGYDGPVLYPFEATFAVPCAETSRFIKDSHLQYAGTGPMLTAAPSEDVDVGSFAQEQGWHSADPLARWYYDTQTYQGTPVPPDYLELMITGRTICTVYLWNQGG